MSDERQSVELLSTGFVTHDTKRFVLERPADLDFEPGQGVEVAVDAEGWRDEGRPFTPTSSPEDPVLELIVKEYPEREGVTRQLHRLEPGASLLVSDSFGAITWTGPGTFLAGGAGVTPFLSILRSREGDGDLDDCRLFFSNKTPADVICERELRALLDGRCHLTYTQAAGPRGDEGRIDRSYLEERLDGTDGAFYVCGPPGFVEDVVGHLGDLGVAEDAIVVEG